MREASDSHAVARNATIAYAGMVATLALNFVLRVVLAHTLSPTELGLLLTAQGIATLGQSVGGLNLPDAVARFIAVWSPVSEPKARGAFRSGVRLTIIASVIVSLALIGASDAMARGFYRQPTLRQLLLVFAAIVPLMAVSDLLAGAARGRGQAWVRVICLDVTRAGASIVLVGGLIVAGETRLVAVALALAAASLLAFLLTTVVSWRDTWLRGPAEGRPDAEVVKFSLPLFGSGLTAWPLQLIPLWLGSIVGPHVVPYFTLSQGLSSLVYMPTMAIDLAILPLWGRLLGSGQRENLRQIYAIASRWCFLLGCLIFVVLLISPEAVLSLLYGSAYVPAAPVLRLTAVLFLCNSVTGPNASLLSSLGLPRLIFFATLSGGVLAAVIGYPLVSRWGISGALLTYLLHTITNVGMCAVLLYRKEHLQPFDLQYVKTIILAAAAMIVVAITLPRGLPRAGELAWVLGIFVGLLGAGLLVFRLMGERERRLIQALTAGVTAAYRPEREN